VIGRPTNVGGRYPVLLQGTVPDEGWSAVVRYLRTTRTIVVSKAMARTPVISAIAVRHSAGRSPCVPAMSRSAPIPPETLKAKLIKANRTPTR
jgi:hypothetical protein